MFGFYLKYQRSHENYVAIRKQAVNSLILKSKRSVIENRCSNANKMSKQLIYLVTKTTKTSKILVCPKMNTTRDENPTFDSIHCDCVWRRGNSAKFLQRNTIQCTAYNYTHIQRGLFHNEMFILFQKFDSSRIYFKFYEFHIFTGKTLKNKCTRKLKRWLF